MLFKFKDNGDNTNLIERFHRTLEQRTQVMATCKNITDIKLPTDGWLINCNFFNQHEGIGVNPPAQARTKVVPFKDWNEVVKPESLPVLDYQVKLTLRRSRVKAKPVQDATLTPISAD